MAQEFTANLVDELSKRDDDADWEIEDLVGLLTSASEYEEVHACAGTQSSVGDWSSCGQYLVVTVVLSLRWPGPELLGRFPARTGASPTFSTSYGQRPQLRGAVAAQS